VSEFIGTIASINWYSHSEVRLRISLYQITIAPLLPLFAVVTSILAVIVVIIAFYLVITRPESLTNHTTTMSVAIAQTPAERWHTFTLSDFNDFFNKFLLSDEIAVLKVMANFLISEGMDFDNEYSKQEKLGWMNKYNIIQESNVSQKRIYSKNGIIDRMEALGIVERKNSDSSWGGMKHLYRLKIESDFVRAYIRALQKNGL
jgi:hypothetical protein